MTKRSWDRDRVRRQMSGPTEEAAPKNDGTKVFVRRPPPALPDWMKDKSILPKKPPGKL